MTRDDYLNHILTMYHLVAVLSSKNDSMVLRLRHRELEKDLVLRSYPHRQPAYEALLRYKCENLPLIYQVETLEDGQIILEEFIDGISLAQIMETGRHHPRGARRVLQRVCNALMVLHGLFFVHRDIKPENIMISNAGRVVLIDFNTARRFFIGGRDTQILGTVGYAAPEQLGLSQSDGRTDIYALGVLYNVMLTGKHPSEMLPGGRAGRIIRKCTAVNPDDRYQTPKKLLQALLGRL